MALISPLLRGSALYACLLLLPFFNQALAQEAEQVYASYCAGCHGASLQGTSEAVPLIKRTWKHGRGKSYLIRNITYGIAGTLMPGWKAALTPEQIEALADFIVDAQRRPISQPPPVPRKVRTRDYALRVEKIVDQGLDSPWAIAFIDEKNALVTERKGQLRVLKDGVLVDEPVKGLPLPLQTRIGGLMDVALDPDYATNGWVYLSMSHTTTSPQDANAPGMTKIIRGRIDQHTWVDQETVFEVPDSLHVAKGHRWGAPLLFDREGYLYFTIGDLAEGEASQNLQKAHGKTYRVFPDGSIPPDNPFVDQPEAIAGIFTLGNRNTQGLAQHPETGVLWSTDHGPMGGDELNILLGGRNYGWPVVTYGIDYDGTMISAHTQKEGMEEPVTYWSPSIAAGAAVFVEGPLFSNWKNDLLVGALAFEEIRRITIEGEQVTDQEVMFKGYGRVRNIELSPDGSIYVVLNRPDMIVRLTPDE